LECIEFFTAKEAKDFYIVEELIKENNRLEKSFTFSTSTSSLSFRRNPNYYSLMRRDSFRMTNTLFNNKVIAYFN